MNIQLGEMHAHSFATDPKHLGFVLARYKFVARMLTGYKSVLEVGCGDCTGAQLVIPAVKQWSGIDIDPSVPKMGGRTRQFDLLGPSGLQETYDAIYLLDVLEHIEPSDEHKFIDRICYSLAPKGVAIVGTPSFESQPYASELSRRHHVNCKTEEGLRAALLPHFHNVFMFGMNDETLHTGFGPMCHYRLAICTNAHG